MAAEKCSKFLQAQNLYDSLYWGLFDLGHEEWNEDCIQLPRLDIVMFGHFLDTLHVFQ